jgi:hypothetical protein
MGKRAMPQLLLSLRVLDVPMNRTTAAGCTQ